MDTLIVLDLDNQMGVSGGGGLERFLRNSRYGLWRIRS